MKEVEIRPQNIFDEYLRLAKKDAVDYFSGVEKVEFDCPACNASGEHAFSKSGFDYSLCPACQTLYVAPRPKEEAFTHYYTESPSSKYWATTFYKKTAEARREKIWKPKAALIAKVLAPYGLGDKNIVDIGGGYGIFAEEMMKHTPRSVMIIEPAPHLAQICREKGFPVIEKFLENVEEADLPKGGKVFVSFELFEHLYSPKDFLSHLFSLMRAGDIFIFTTLSGLGIDIQLLWENSKSVSPPHHLNLFNPKSAELLLKKVGFDVLKSETPGKLDLDIMSNSREHIKDRFWKTFLAEADDSVKIKWQNLISETGWSSHMMIVCQKPKGS